MLKRFLLPGRILTVIFFICCIFTGCFGGSSDDDQDTTLSAPANLQVTGEAFSSVSLSWDKVAGASGYYIYQSATGTAGTFSEAEQIYAGSQTTCTISGLTKSTDYYFKATAYSGQVESGDSNIVNATTADSITPPAGLAVLYKSSIAVYLSWLPLIGAGEYRVYVSTTGDPGTYNRITTTDPWTYTTFCYYGKGPGTQLGPNETYYYMVTAVEGANESAMSSAVSATTNSTWGVAAPTNLSAGATTSSTIPLSWDAVALASGYNIYIFNGIFNILMNKSLYVSGTSVTITGLSSGTAYSFKVTAVNSSNAETALSDVATATTL